MRTTGFALALVAATLLSTSCGTRVDQSAASTAATGRSPGNGLSPTPEGQGSVQQTSAATPPSPGDSPRAFAAPSSLGPSGASSRPAASGQTPTAPASNAPVPAGAKPSSPTAGAVAAPGAPTTEAALTSEGQKKSPLVVATLCNCSGPPSSAALPIVQGAQIWIKHINERGGLNGHLVRQVLYDDGSDPARNRAQSQEAVEREHAVAFFVEAAPLSAKGTADYITSQGIPVVGTVLSDSWNYESPMYFPQASSDRAAAYGAVAGAAQQLVPSGKTKIALAYCAEAEQCARIKKTWVEFARTVGFDVVYESPISLAQPDYTAVCLAVRNAGAQVIAVLADVNSLSRFAASCARQGLDAAYAAMPQTVAERFKDDPNIKMFAAGVNVFPFFQSGTPATDEYRAALAKHGGGRIVAGVGTATGWVAGKLMEKVGAGLPEPPTSQAILRGLWSLKNDDLGGITQPLTFVQGQPATKTACWFNIATQGGRWVSLDGFERHCAAAPLN